MSQDETRDEGQPNLMSPEDIARRQRQTEEMEARDASQSAARAATTPPPALDDDAAALEASIRMKFERGEPLGEEEKRFLANLPGARRVEPGPMRRPADRA